MTKRTRSEHNGPQKCVRRKEANQQRETANKALG